VDAPGLRIIHATTRSSRAMPDPHIVAYYQRMAPALLPFLAGRRVSLRQVFDGRVRSSVATPKPVIGSTLPIVMP
jgi:DNA primase